MNKLIRAAVSALALVAGGKQMKKELVLAAALIGVALTASPAHAIGCWATVRTTITLQEDLLCPSSTLRVMGPNGRLNLNGHTIACGDDDDFAGIQMIGRGGTITGGRLQECYIRLRGRGAHRATNLEIENTRPPAVWIESSDNAVLSNDLYSRRSVAVLVAKGQSNLIADNVLAGRDGLVIDGGRRNYLINNFIEEAEIGFAVHTTGNRIFSNSFAEGAGCVRTGHNQNLDEGNTECQPGG